MAPALDTAPLALMGRSSGQLLCGPWSSQDKQLSAPRVPVHQHEEVEEDCQDALIATGMCLHNGACEVGAALLIKPFAEEEQSPRLMNPHEFDCALTQLFKASSGSRLGLSSPQQLPAALQKRSSCSNPAASQQQAGSMLECVASAFKLWPGNHVALDDDDDDDAELSSGLPCSQATRDTPFRCGPQSGAGCQHRDSIDFPDLCAGACDEPSNSCASTPSQIPAHLTTPACSDALASRATIASPLGSAHLQHHPTIMLSRAHVSRPLKRSRQQAKTPLSLPQLSLSSKPAAMQVDAPQQQQQQLDASSLPQFGPTSLLPPVPAKRKRLSTAQGASAPKLPGSSITAVTATGTTTRRHTKAQAR